MSAGGNLGFMQITIFFQSMRMVNQAERVLGPLRDTNQQKTSYKRTFLGRLDGSFAKIGLTTRQSL